MSYYCGTESGIILSTCIRSYLKQYHNSIMSDGHMPKVYHCLKSSRKEDPNDPSPHYYFSDRRYAASANYAIFCGVLEFINSYFVIDLKPVAVGVGVDVDTSPEINFPGHIEMPDPTAEDSDPKSKESQFRNSFVMSLPRCIGVQMNESEQIPSSDPSPKDLKEQIEQMRRFYQEFRNWLNAPPRSVSGGKSWDDGYIAVPGGASVIVFVDPKGVDLVLDEARKCVGWIRSLSEGTQGAITPVEFQTLVWDHVASGMVAILTSYKIVSATVGLSLETATPIPLVGTAKSESVDMNAGTPREVIRVRPEITLPLPGVEMTIPLSMDIPVSLPIITIPLKRNVSGVIMDDKLTVRFSIPPINPKLSFADILAGPQKLAEQIMAPIEYAVAATTTRVGEITTALADQIPDPAVVKEALQKATGEVIDVGQVVIDKVFKAASAPIIAIQTTFLKRLLYKTTWEAASTVPQIKAVHTSYRTIRNIKKISNFINVIIKPWQAIILMVNEIIIPTLNFLTATINTLVRFVDAFMGLVLDPISCAIFTVKIPAPPKIPKIPDIPMPHAPATHQRPNVAGDDDHIPLDEYELRVLFEGDTNTGAEPIKATDTQYPIKKPLYEQLVTTMQTPFEFSEKV